MDVFYLFDIVGYLYTKIMNTFYIFIYIDLLESLFLYDLIKKLQSGPIGPLIKLCQHKKQQLPSTHHHLTSSHVS